ncbi:MAG: alpha/beta fold hydrolase [Thermodesulfovibrionales bacterium]
MKNNANTWYLLPGMGANPSYYDSLLKEINFEVNFVTWPAYKGEKTFSAMAKRFIDENGIKDGDIVGGSSLGGIVALEMARHIQPRAIVLMGSAVSRAEVQRILVLLAPLAVIAPVALIQRLAGKYENIVTRMFAEAEPELIRAMCQYLPGWPGAAVSNAALFRIHGQKDLVMPCPKTGCEKVPKAGHLLALTHPVRCGNFLNKLDLQLTIDRGASE